MSKRMEDILGWVIFSFFIIVLFICLQNFGGAEKKYTKENASYENEWYSTVYEGSWYDIVYDNDTKVMYSKSTLSGSYGALTLLVNPDGTPRLYEEEE